MGFGNLSCVQCRTQRPDQLGRKLNQVNFRECLGQQQPTESELPNEGSGAGKSLILLQQLNPPPRPRRTTPPPIPAQIEISPSRRGCAVPIYSRCSPFNLVLRCSGYKWQSFGQLLSGSKFSSRGRECGRLWRGKGGRGKKAEIEKLLKGLLQPVRSINLG